MRKTLLLGLFFIAYTISEAQIFNIHNFYTQNLFYYLPAHTGDKNHLAAFAGYRKHLSDIDGGEQTSFFGIHSPVTENMNLGGLLNTKQVGLYEKLSARLDYSFRTEISEKSILGFGINAGVMQTKINADNVVVFDTGDPALLPSLSRKNIFFAGASVNFSSGNFNADIGIPYIYKSEDLTVSAYTAYVSYNIRSKDGIWKFSPSFLTVYSNSDIFDAHANLFIMYDNTVWIQPAYKLNGSFVVSAGVNLRKLGIGYAYETNSGALSYIGGASHEIILSYGLFENNKELSDVTGENNGENPDLKRKINGKTYEEYVKANNYGFYNDILDLTDSIHKEEIRKIEEKKRVKQDSLDRAKALADSLFKAKQDSLNKARLDSVAKAKQDSARKHALRHLNDDELKILQKGVHFNINSAMLTPESREYLDTVAELIKKNDNIKVLITGYTCDLGSREVNLRFSIDRAEAVKYYLLQRGVPPNRISTDAGLDAEPVVPNTNEENRKLNRRVGFSIIRE